MTPPTILRSRARREIIVSNFKTIYPVLIIGAALFAFFLQPLVRYTDVHQCYPGVLIFTISLVDVFLAFSQRLHLAWVLLGAAGVFVGLFMLVGVIESASNAAPINDERCLKIEIEMLEPTPRRDDLAGIFTALACRPQSDRALQFPSKVRAIQHCWRVKLPILAVEWRAGR